MRVAAAVVAVLIVATGASFADYVTLDDWGDFGLGYHDFHYTYYRDAGSTLVDNQSTWTLFNVAGLSASFSDSTGPVYWDNGTFISGNTAVMWTYIGPETLPQQDNYTTFDLIVYHPTGHIDLIPFEVDIDGDGEADFSSTVAGPTPEPGTMALAVLGLSALAVRVRRRRA